MSLISYPHAVVGDANQPIFNEAVKKVKTCSKHAAVALAAFAVKIAYVVLTTPKSVDNNITIYDSDAESSFITSFDVYVIFTLLFGGGIYGVFAHLCNENVKDKEPSCLCLKEVEPDETIKFESMNLEWLDLPIEIIENHMQTNLRVQTIGVIGKVSKQWNVVSKHMLVRGLNALPLFVFNELNFNSPDKGIKAVEDYFGEHTVKITHLPGECPVSNYEFKKFPNLEEFTFAPSILKGATNHTIELGPKVRHLKWNISGKWDNLKIQNLKKLESLVIDDWYYSIYWDGACIDIENLPEAKEISVNGGKIQKLNFDRCSPSKLHLGSRILNHNISSFSDLKDLVIGCHNDLNVSLVFNPSIERVHLHDWKMFEKLPYYPLLNTLVLGINDHSYEGLDGIEHLIKKYPKLNKLIIVLRKYRFYKEFHDYITGLKEKFKPLGVEVVEINRYLEHPFLLDRSTFPEEPDPFFTEPKIELGIFSQKKTHFYCVRSKGDRGKGDGKRKSGWGYSSMRPCTLYEEQEKWAVKPL